MNLKRILKRRKLQKKRSDEPDYLTSWLEWQDKQYVSGYYTGGRIPPFYKYLVRPHGAFYIAGGCLLLGLIVYRTLFDPMDFDQPGDYFATALTAGLGITFIYSGIVRIRMKSHQRKHQ